MQLLINTGSKFPTVTEFGRIQEIEDALTSWAAINLNAVSNDPKVLQVVTKPSIIVTSPEYNLMLTRVKFKSPCICSIRPFNTLFYTTLDPLLGGLVKLPIVIVKSQSTFLTDSRSEVLELIRNRKRKQNKTEFWFGGADEGEKESENNDTNTSCPPHQNKRRKVKF